MAGMKKPIHRGQPEPSPTELILRADVDLIGRTGARDCDVGYGPDDAIASTARWHAIAQYSGGRQVRMEDHPTAISATTALASRLLNGGQCQICGSLVALTQAGAFAYSKAVLMDGRPWDAETAAAAGQCQWQRRGGVWISACDTSADRQPHTRSIVAARYIMDRVLDLEQAELIHRARTAARGGPTAG